MAELCRVTASLYKEAADPFALSARFGIADKKNSPVKDLSGGQKQRLFIVLCASTESWEVVFLERTRTRAGRKSTAGGMENTF